MSDVDVIATYSEWADEYDRLTAADWSFANDQRKAELAETLHDHAGDFTDAALREIDRLRAENERLRAELQFIQEMAAEDIRTDNAYGSTWQIEANARAALAATDGATARADESAADGGAK